MAPSSSTFAHANASFDEAFFVIVGVPYERAHPLRSGARGGPDAIRQASNIFEPYLFEHNLSLDDIPIHDMGNVGSRSTEEKMRTAVQTAAADILEANKFPIFLGGEHSISVPVISAYSDIGVISIDAHLDFEDEDEGSRMSNACFLRRASEHVGIENVLAFGVRSFSQEEREERMPNYIDAYQIQEQGVEHSWKIALNMMRREKVYLSLDIDGVDPGFAPGTERPEPFGLSPYQVKRCINMLGERLVGFDITEVAPSYDRGGTAALAARTVLEVMSVVWTQRQRKLK